MNSLKLYKFAGREKIFKERVKMLDGTYWYFSGLASILCIGTFLGEPCDQFSSQQSKSYPVMFFIKRATTIVGLCCLTCRFEVIIPITFSN
jgi:hypothetical protein